MFTVISILLALCSSSLCGTAQNVRSIPKHILLGAASSAFQVEGAWNIDGKTESIADHLVHSQKCYAKDCSNADVAANSYYMYKRDVEMLRELGVDFYRFSLSWTRILPTGFPDKVNEAGVQYYSNLIDELLKYKIQPVVTIFHWDLPQKLQQLGGWTNPHIVNWYGDFARVAFSLFGDRVKYWITINEPHQLCHYGYGSPYIPPAMNLTGEADYLCSKNVLLAHARGYHIYDKEFRLWQEGMIFITINAEWFEPESEHDYEAAIDANQFWWGLYTHPILSRSGDYPEIVKHRIAVMSTKQGLLRSRLPELSSEEINYIRGTTDILGLNHYTSYLAYRNASTEEYYGNITGPSFDADCGAMNYQPGDWQIGETNATMYAPWGFYKLLTFIRFEYDNIPVFITENGFGNSGALIDDDRVLYYRGYLSAMLDAICDGSHIVGYTTWSLMDSFEWPNGYSIRIGLYQVDYNNTSLPRTPRKSAYVYKEIIRSRTLDMNYEPDMTIPLSVDNSTSNRLTHI
ncbi:myrosinase 1-like [Leptidea sinapis]|uniref:myrosinase 1-like n=1 Tax=Leptidea sinapis TaxID=189913 RepID=UPI002125A99D|nr:myrosinase 1-like [Leptidea sinapis]